MHGRMPLPTIAAESVPPSAALLNTLLPWSDFVTALARPGRAWVDPEDRRRILVQLLDRSSP
jgi:hypothetical protein